MKLSKSFIVKVSSSLKLTVICLLLLAIITIWGTIYQADHGLYQAQSKFFHSWFFLIFGFIPFPGTVLIMTVLFINLVSSLIFRIRIKFSNLGNLLIHSGILIFLVGGFFTFYFAEESILSLKESEESNLASAYHNWELAMWKEGSAKRQVHAIMADNLKKNDSFFLERLNLGIIIEKYYTNCNAYLKPKSQSKSLFINASNIHSLENKPKEKNPSANSPGIVFYSNENPDNKILLFGGEFTPTTISLNNQMFSFSLRKKRHPLPFSLRLIDFRMENHPGTEIPKSYESQVELKTNTLLREALISMNHPLRFKEYTVYQSSYLIDQNGTEHTVLALVKNTGRLFPYISSFIVLIGMFIHFLMMLSRKKNTTISKGSQSEKIE
jgi:hypothetical protein